MKRWQEAKKGDLSIREMTIPTAIEMISERPVFGWHPVEFAYELSARIGRWGDSMDAHNLLLSMLAEVGIAGTLPFLVGLWLCCRTAWMARRGDLGLIPLALLLAVLAVNMGIPALIWKPFWLVMGFTLAAAPTAAMQQARYGRLVPLQRAVP
jgi:O-antigen ligase